MDRYPQVYLTCPSIGHLMLEDLKTNQLTPAAHFLEESCREAWLTFPLGIPRGRGWNRDSSERSTSKSLLTCKDGVPIERVFLP